MASRCSRHTPFCRATGLAAPGCQGQDERHYAAAFDAPSTAKAAELLHAHRGGSVLVALGDDEFTAAKSFRNLSRVHVLHVDDVGVADLVGAATLVVSQAALDSLTERARKLQEAKA